MLCILVAVDTVSVFAELDESCDFFFFFKQKTAYEMRISDWSSDVCSSDLVFASDCTADSVDPGGAANICEVVAKMLARLRPSPKHLLSVVRRTTLFHRLQYAWNLLIMEHDRGTDRKSVV